MRKAVFGGASSLDNFFARKDGGMDWLMWSDETAELMKDMWTRYDTIVMGRKTYEVAMAARGEVEETGSGGEGETADSGMRTFVFSRTIPAGKTSGGAEIVGSDPGEFVRELKSQDGKDICVMGGGDLARSLLDAGVIDEIGFNIHPVLLGSGIPLFYEMSRQIDLELVECKALKNGCIYVLYRVKN
jgi:dihydrofolate reductase